MRQQIEALIKKYEQKRDAVSKLEIYAGGKGYPIAINDHDVDFWIYTAIVADLKTVLMIEDQYETP